MSLAEIHSAYDSEWVLLADLVTEWFLADMQVAEKRVEKLRVQVKKPTPAKQKEEDEAELAVLERCAAALAKEEPLGGLALDAKDLARVKHFGFFTGNTINVRIKDVKNKHTAFSQIFFNIF